MEKPKDPKTTESPKTPQTPSPSTTSQPPRDTVRLWTKEEVLLAVKEGRVSKRPLPEEMEEEEDENGDEEQEANLPVIDQFITETFIILGHNKNDIPPPQGSYQKPESIDYKEYSDNSDHKKYAHYTLNPEQPPSFENAKVFIPDLSFMVGNKERYEVMKYVVDRYGTTHYIPDIHYWKWCIENPTKAPQELKDGRFYYFPGSILCSKSGNWSFPVFNWRGSLFFAKVFWIGYYWGTDSDIVLLKR